MSRRRVIGALAVLPALTVRAVRSAPALKRIGILSQARREEWLAARATSGMTEGLAALGWVEGRNLEYVMRFAEDDISRFRALARELVGERPDLIITSGTPRTRELQQATRTIPIVTSVGDPVGAGFAKSLAQPGGNITGLSQGVPEKALKQMEVLRALLPRLSMLVLADQHGPEVMRELFGVVIETARAMGVSAILRKITTLAEFEAVIREVPSGGRGALWFGNVAIDEKELVALCRSRRVPTLVQSANDVRNGGLVTYELTHHREVEKLARLADRLLRGEDPARIPFDLPDLSRASFNLGTARAIGVVPPAGFLARFDEVVE
jgi:putative ABC transport system substrate-binding protein